MSTGRPPKVIAESTMTVGAATLRVSVLDNGMRVIDAADVDRFFAGGGDPQQLTDAWRTATEADLARAVRDRAALLTACVVAEDVLAQLLDEHGGEGDRWNGLSIVRDTIAQAERG